MAGQLKEVRNRIKSVQSTQQITKAMKAGIGEIVKEGEMLVEIVPDQLDYAVVFSFDLVISGSTKGRNAFAFANVVTICLC